MGGQGDDSSDDSTATPAPAPLAPAPPPPAPPPPAHLDDSGDSSVMSAASSYNAWTSDNTPATPAPVTSETMSFDHSSDYISSYNARTSDDTPKVAPATQAPATSETMSFDHSSDYISSYEAGASDNTPKVQAATPASVASVTPSFDHSSDYGNTLFGDAEPTSSFSSPFDQAHNTLVEAKPLDNGGTAPVDPFDVAQKLIAASTPVRFDTPSTPVHSELQPDAPATYTPAHFDAPSTSLANDMDVSANAWGAMFDTPASPDPVKAVAAASPTQESTPDWKTRWAIDNADTGVKVLSAWDAPAAPAVAAVETPKRTKAEDEDSISRMRRLFKESSLLQMKKKGHMVSIKLHRGK